MNNRIKEIREKNNLNRSQFAKKIEISPSAVQYIEIGKTKPSIDTIKKICELFNESADWIILGKKTDENILHNLNDTEKEIVLNIIDNANKRESNIKKAGNL